MNMKHWETFIKKVHKVAKEKNISNAEAYEQVKKEMVFGK